MRRDLKGMVGKAARRALGGPVPASITVLVSDENRTIELIGPPASGKTRIARALLAVLPSGERARLKILTGYTRGTLEREFLP